MKKEKQQKNIFSSSSGRANRGVRYTAMMPDIPFLILGLFSDIGWIMHLIAGILYLVAYIIYLNKIHEKDIATRHQKNFSCGLIVYAGLAGALIGIV